MYRLAHIGFALLLLAFAAGCDTTEDSRSEAELFVGSWTLVKVEDTEGDKTALMNQAGKLSIVFKADGKFDLLYDPADGSEDQTLSNTYLVAEATNVLTLNATNPFTQAPLPLEVTYDYRSDNEVVLTIPASTVLLVGTIVPPFAALKGQAKLTLKRV